jgi:hypothetical protein
MSTNDFYLPEINSNRLNDGTEFNWKKTSDESYKYTGDKLSDKYVYVNTKKSTSGPNGECIRIRMYAKDNKYAQENERNKIDGIAINYSGSINEEKLINELVKFEEKLE